MSPRSPCRPTTPRDGASSTRCSISRAESSSRTENSWTATTSTRRRPRSPKCRSGSRTAGPRPRPNIPPRSPSSPRARRRCTSTASGKCRRWSTSPRRARSSTGARSRSRLSTIIPRPGRTRTPSRSPIARAIQSMPPSARKCWTPSTGSTNTRSNGRAAVTCRLSCRCRRAPNSRRSSRTRTMCRSPRPRSSIPSRPWPASRRRSMTRPATTSCPQ